MSRLPDTTPRSYVRYRPDLEQPLPDEGELIRQVVEATGKANQQVADEHRHVLRDAHAKSHGVLAGELRIQSGLPAHLAQGLFTEPATYPVIVRFSSAPGDLRSDQGSRRAGAEGPRR